MTDQNQRAQSKPASTATIPAVFGAVVLCVVVAIVGGWLTGLAVDQFGEVGSVTVWLVGVLAGLVVNRMGWRGNAAVLVLVIVGLALAGVVAEVCWMRWNIQQADSWSAAIQLLPRFALEYRTSAFVMLIFIVFGSMSAYHQWRVAEPVR